MCPDVNKNTRETLCSYAFKTGLQTSSFWDLKYENLLRYTLGYSHSNTPCQIFFSESWRLLHMELFVDWFDSIRIDRGTPTNSQYYRWFMTVVFGQMPWLFCPSMINAFNLALSWADMEVRVNHTPNSNMTVLGGMSLLWWKYLQRSRFGL